MKISISIKKITMFLMITVVSLHAIGFIGRTIEYLLGYKETNAIVRLFHPALEANIIVWVSSLLLLSSALLMTIIAITKNARADFDRKYWSILSIIFFFLSLDEVAQIHEILIEPLRSFFNLSGIFYFSWVLAAIPLLCIFFVYFFKFYVNLPQTTKYLFGAAAIIYITGALGMEMLAGFFLSKEITYFEIIIPMLVTVEEFLENVGVVVFIHALLLYIKSNLKLNTISLAYS